MMLSGWAFAGSGSQDQTLKTIITIGDATMLSITLVFQSFMMGRMRFAAMKLFVELFFQKKVS